MQTFVPYEDHPRSAAALDTKRLGKQRVETLQIMTALCTGRGWVHHPATKMWAGHERALLAYQEAVCDQWWLRGFDDTCMEKTAAVCDRGSAEAPWWLGVPEMHLSHQANLRVKDPFYAHMADRWSPDPYGREYLWPQHPGTFRIGRKTDSYGSLSIGTP